MEGTEQRDILKQVKINDKAVRMCLKASQEKLCTHLYQSPMEGPHPFILPYREMLKYHFSSSI